MTDAPAPKRLELDYPEMDFEFMPPILRDLIDSESKRMQIDPVIPFTIALGVALTATRGRVKSMINESWIQHPSLYLCPIAETADGKSQIMNRLRAPLIKAEAKLQMEAKEHHALQSANYEIAEQKLKAIKDSRSKIGGNAKSLKSPASEADLIAAIDEVKKYKPDPLPLILVGGDITPDRLTELIGVHKSLGMLDAEGTLFNQFAGKRYGTSPAWEILLAATTGDPTKTHRIGRGDSVVLNPHLVICAAVQPDVWLELIKDKHATNRGVVGRFVPLAAKSRRGYRDVRSIEKYPINQGLLDQWEHLILTILDSKTERMLKLTKDGFELFQLNRANWERKLDVEDNYLDGYGNRLFGNLITIAMIFTLMMNPDQNEFIDDQALFMALALADPLIAHRRLADNLKFEQRPEIRVLDKLALWMDEIDDERNQQGVDVWMRNQDYRINKREFHMRMKGQNWLKIGGIDALDKALKELASNSWLELDSGDHEIFPNPYLREHHRDKFRATNVPLQSENATKMPL